MRLHNKIQLLSVMNAHLVAYPTPMNLNWSWNGGSLAGIMLASQMVTGILLAMHYVSHVDYAFASVQHLMTDVPSGMILRYAHANGASMFFIVVYLHIFRGMYYNSGAQPREMVWITGVVILLVMVLTAFIGYVLPWGQMSFWGKLNAPYGSCYYLLTSLFVFNCICYVYFSFSFSVLSSMVLSSILFAKRVVVGTTHDAFFKPRVSALKRFGPHGWLFAQVAVSILLSDGHAEVHGNGVRVSLQQEDTHRAYFMFVLKILYKLGYVSSMETKAYTRMGDGRMRTYYRLNTFTFGSLIWLRELFYDSNGIKRVYPELYLYLTPISLAHAICGDGTWCGYGMALCTNSFTLEDSNLLISMLHKKFGLICTPHKTGAPGQYRVYVQAESIPLLRTMVLPHMPVEMHYKLGIGTKAK